MSVPEFLPRAYQEEIFEQARASNVICAMDTGAGKTYIAVLLTRWVASQTMDTPDQNSKKIIFIVPKVPLVDQQAAVFKAHTPLRVQGYCGEMGVDLWNREKWRKELHSHDILVMTAQIFYDLLVHAHWSLSLVSLLIFDEAHHCRKKHPYNQIMNDHYVHTPPNERPKIFGMTASPVWNVKNPRGAISELEANLRAKVIASRLNVSELNKHSPRPKERVEIYPSAPLGYRAYISPTLWEQCAPLLRDQDFKDPEQRGTRYRTVLDALGPFAADFWLFGEIQRLLDEVKRANATSISEIERMGALNLSETQWTPPEALLPLYQALDERKHYFDETAPLNMAWISPKVKSLVDVLLSAKSPNFQGMVFAEQRHVTATLAWLLNRISALTGWLKSAFIVGHGTAGNNAASLRGEGMQFQHQANTVKQFREGVYNLLIATSVAEEGLDFQACHLIIRFDVFKTMVAYVQSRGRARHPDSVYVVMVDASNAEDRARYEDMKRVEPILRQQYQTPSAEKHDGSSDDEDDDGEDFSETYTVATTGARLTPHAAIGMLSYLCSLIPKDKYCPSLQPKYTVTSTIAGFRAIVQLPSSLPLPSNDRVFEGPLRPSRKWAKRSAAFVAARALHILGSFDEYLLPGKQQRGEGTEDADGKISVRTSDIPKLMNIHVREPFGNMWMNDARVFLHPLYFDGVARTALVTGNGISLPETTFPSADGRSHRVHLAAAIPLTWPSSKERIACLALMDKFSAEGVYWGATSSWGPKSQKFRSEQSAVLLIPIANGQPDYDVMQLTLDNTMTPVFEPEVGQLIYCYMYAGRPYTLTRVRRDLTPFSAPIKFGDHFPEGEYDSYQEYYQSKSPRRLLFAPKEPLLQLRLTPKHQIRASTLDRLSDTLPSDHSESKDHITLIPISLCRRISVPRFALEIFRIFPSILRHITDLYRANFAQRALGLPPLNMVRLVEALTTPSANVGYHYQRLETLGDCVLKLATSVHVYNKFPHRHEGQLDWARQNSVNNAYLLGRAHELGLQQYFVAETMVARTWIPPLVDHHVFDDNGSLLADIEAPRKCMQDIMEALLGASYLTGGIPAALKAGTALGLCFGGTEIWTTRYDPVQHLPSSSPLMQPLENALGYKFNNWKLLLEAMTHPSFQSTETTSYQRLEFLGDAVIDMFVTQYLFRTYPEATPGQITWAKSRSVCNPVLGTVAAKELSLQKYLFASSPKLFRTIENYLTIIESVKYSDLVRAAWKFDPPKVLADMLEAVIGAVFVDSGFDLNVVDKVLAPLMKDVLGAVYPGMPRDPVTELMIWVHREGCREVRFQKSRSNPADLESRLDSMSVFIHNEEVHPPIRGVTRSLAKAMAAERALQLLQDKESPKSMKNMCWCKYTNARNSGGQTAMDCDVWDDEDDFDQMDATDEDDVNRILRGREDEDEGAMSNDETTTGFGRRAALAAHVLDRSVAQGWEDVWDDNDEHSGGRIRDDLSDDMDDMDDMDVQML